MSSQIGFNIRLREEQNVAVNCLLDGGDVLVVLPTGFGKSLIFQTWVKVLSQGEPSTLLVVSPLNSITQDQMSEANELGISTASLSDLGEGALERLDCQLLFGSAENTLNEEFLSAIKHKDAALHRHLSGVVYELHVIEMWTGKR